MSDGHKITDYSDTPIEEVRSIETSEVKSSLDETSVGQIPDDWEAVRLGDITLETEYGLTESAEEYDPSKPRYIRTQDFDNFGGLDENSLASLSEEKAVDGILEKGDLLFARSGSVGASLGKTYLYDPDDGECCFGGYSIRHRIVENGINNIYLLQYTLSENYWDWIRRRAKTSAQSNINTGEYASLLIPLPPIEEQRKIATILSNIDKMIDTQAKMIGKPDVHRGEKRYKGKLVQLKVSLMEDLLSGKVRTADTNIEVPDEIARHG